MRLRYLLAAAAALAASPAAAQYTAPAGLWNSGEPAAQARQVPTAAPTYGQVGAVGRPAQGWPTTQPTYGANPYARQPANPWADAPARTPASFASASTGSMPAPSEGMTYAAPAGESLHSRCDSCNPVPGISVGVCANCQGGYSVAPAEQVYGGGYSTEPVLTSGNDCYTPCVMPPRRRWFASLSALIMERDRPNKLWLSWESARMPYQPYLVLHAPAAETMYGGEVTFGRYIGCQSRIAASFWMLSRSDTVSTFNAGRLGGEYISSTFDETTPPMSFSDARLVEDYFDDSQAHRVRRQNEFYNVELNFLHGSLSCLGGCGLGGCGAGGCDPCGASACGAGGCCGSRLRADLLLGARFLRFDENLAFTAVAQGATWGQGTGSEQATIEQDVVNNLIGFQVGSQMAYFISPCFSLFATPKVGIYGNVINSNPRIYRGDGDMAYDRSYSKNDVSLMGELDLGGRLCFCNRFSIFGGYRVLGISGVALADENMPRFVTVSQQWSEIYSNGSLLLHGAFVGGEVLF